MRKVIGLGAGGHAKVVIDILRLTGLYELFGLLDPKRKLWGTLVEGVTVLGDDELLSELCRQGVRHAFIGLGTTGDTRPRQRLYEKVLSMGFQIIEAIHPRAIITDSVEVSQGPTIMANSVINAATRLGANVIVNTGAIVEHDCIIEDHVHIASGAHLASTVYVGEGAHIGIGASILQAIKVGQHSVVGAGAVVVRDVPDNVTVVGVPARLLKRR